VCMGDVTVGEACNDYNDCSINDKCVAVTPQFDLTQAHAAAAHSLNGRSATTTVVALMKTCALKFFPRIMGPLPHFSDADDRLSMAGLAMTMTYAPSTMFASPNSLMNQSSVAHQLLPALAMTITIALRLTLVSCRRQAIMRSARAHPQ
jgi:hypothetical protein